MKNIIIIANIVFCILTLDIQCQNTFFIKNMGQWDSNILYLANGEGYKLLIAKNGIFINQQLIKNIQSVDKEDDYDKNSNKSYLLSSSDIKMNFLNSNIAGSINHSEIIELDSLDFTVNYLNYGDEGRFVYDVPVYKSISLKNIYDGINLKFYFEHDNIRYDFELSKNVNSELIELNYEGCDKIEIENNEIKLTTKLGVIYNGKIKSFQVSKEKLLNTKIFLKSNTIKFSIEELNNKGLTIDPLLYATFYDGILAKEIMYYYNAIRHNDEYYLFHNAFFDDFIFTDTLYHPDTIFIKDPGAVSVFDKEFKKIKRIYYGRGISSDLTYIDKYNNLITYMGLSYNLKSKYKCYSYKDSCISYITKFDLLSKKINKAIGYRNASYIFKFETNNNNQLFLIGEEAKDKFKTTDNAYSKTCISEYDSTYPDAKCRNGFVTVFDENLDSVLFASFIPNSMRCFDICFDEEDNFYITGQSLVSDFKGMLFDEFIDEPDKSENPSNGTTFVVKFDKYFNKIKAVGIYNAIFTQIEFSKQGEIILGGNLQSSNFPIKNGCLPLKSPTTMQVALMALDKDLKYQRSCVIDAGDGVINSLGGTIADQPKDLGSMKLDEIGNVYFTGSINGNYPIVNETNYRTGVYFNDFDISLTKVNSDFTKILYSTAYGGIVPEYSYYLDIQDSIITIIGETGSQDLKTTPDALMPIKKHPVDHQFYFNSLFAARFSISTTDIEEEQTNNSFIYPNPSENNINLNETLVQKYNSYQIYDIMGRHIKSDNLTSWQIKISDLPQGTYYLRLQNNSSIKVIGFMKK
jgi:hypothetical protein